MNPTNGQTIAQTDWGQLILMGNDIAMEWWAATQGKEFQTRIPGTTVPTRDAVFTTQMLIVGAVALAAIFLLRK